MYLSKRCLPALFTLTLLAATCRAEDIKEPDKFYKLEFVVKEVSGSRVLNSRSYMTTISRAVKGEIRAGSKIPFVPSAGNIQMIDIGVNFDVSSVREVQEKLAFDIVSEVSSLAETSAESKAPTIRQNRWRSGVVIPLKKPTLLFSSDNVDSKSQMQIEVTATPVL